MHRYRLSRFSFAPAALLVALSVLGAHNVCADVDWTKFDKSFIISFPGYKGLSTLTDFPVLIRLSAARNDFDYSRCANGADLRFSDAGGNVLSHEIDTWNPVGESLVWVKVPLFNAETKITAHYGFTGEGLLPAVESTDVWSAGYVGVWHMRENGVPLAESSGVSVSISTDSTGGKAAYGYAGAIGNAVDLSAAGWTHFLAAEDNDAFDGFTEFTLEIWTKQNTWRSGANNNSVLIAKRIYGSTDQSYYWYLNRANGLDGPAGALISTNGVNNSYATGNRVKPEADVWTHQAFVRDTAANNYRAFVGGGNTYTSTNSFGMQPVFAGSGPLYIGGWSNAFAFPGQIDEVRISRVARSPDWISATSDCVAKDSFASCEANANDWDAYSHKFTVSFTGYKDNETLTDFPALVRISEYDEESGEGLEGFSYADCLKPNGGDLRFEGPNGEPLACEVDTWHTNGESLVWVKVPTLPFPGKITAYYGWKFAPSIDSTDVWSNEYVGVWHMKETGLPLAESSGVSTPIDSGSATVVYGYEGAVGNAVDMKAAGAGWANYLSAADDDDLDGFTDFTLEMWTRQEEWGAKDNPILLAKRNGKDCAYYWYCRKVNDQRAANIVVSTNATNAAADLNGHTTCPPLGEWTHQAIIRKTAGNYISAYINGVNSWSRNSYGTNPIVSNGLRLAFGSGVNGYPFPGQIDEVRISRIARSKAWLKATHDTVTEADFATYTKAFPTARRTIIYFK